jgi:hypothetical protein
MKEQLAKSLVGTCGVFYVSAELSRRGWIAMPTIKNTRGIDIIASKEDKAVNIQVKTNSYGKTKYPLGIESENLKADQLFYAFVTLKSKEERPEFYIVPSKFVADYVKKTHKHWSTLPPRLKKLIYEKTTAEEIIEKRQKTNLRRFPNYIGRMLDEFKDFTIENYQDKWDLLENLVQ